MARRGRVGLITWTWACARESVSLVGRRASDYLKTRYVAARIAFAGVGPHLVAFIGRCRQVFPRQTFIYACRAIVSVCLLVGDVVVLRGNPGAGIRVRLVSSVTAGLPIPRLSKLGCGCIS